MKIILTAVVCTALLSACATAPNPGVIHLKIDKRKQQELSGSNTGEIAER